MRYAVVSAKYRDEIMSLIFDWSVKTTSEIWLSFEQFKSFGFSEVTHRWEPCDIISYITTKWRINIEDIEILPCDSMEGFEDSYAEYFI